MRNCRIGYFKPYSLSLFSSFNFDINSGYFPVDIDIRFSPFKSNSGLIFKTVFKGNASKPMVINIAKVNYNDIIFNLILSFVNSFNNFKLFKVFITL